MKKYVANHLVLKDYVVIIVGLSLSLLLIVLVLPNTQFTRAVGVIDFQQRVYALRQALYWQSRVVMHPEHAVDHRILYGFVNAVMPDGKVEISYANDSKYVTERFQLADLKIQNYAALDTFFKQNQSMGIKADVYGDMVVLHFDGVMESMDKDVQAKPLNIQFIEKGDAIPDPNPPTNIVDRAFAAHYWKMTFGAQEKTTL